MATSLLTTKTRRSSKVESSLALRSYFNLRMLPPTWPRLSRPLTSFSPTIQSSPQRTSAASSIGNLAHAFTEERYHGMVRPSICVSLLSISCMTTIWSRETSSNTLALITPKTEHPRLSSSTGSSPAISNVADSQVGSKHANREYEVGRGMNVNDVDDEQSQQAKWRR